VNFVALLFACAGIPSEPWVAAIGAALPDLDIRVWPDYGDAEDIEYALLWGSLAAELGRFPRLRAVLSFGAGVDHILNTPGRPQDVPVVRLVDPAFQAGMAEYVLFNVLRFHRRFAEYDDQQRRGVWACHAQRTPASRRIGILGMGILGTACAESLVALGFDVSGWSRSPKSIAGVDGFTGGEGLTPFLARSEILVCLLPLTAETEDILDRRAFDSMPRGGFLINAGRGRHVVDADLLAALDGGQIAGAALDVFRTEPLPANHPFWTHPKIRITPHIAALVNVESASATIVDTIRRLRDGRKLLNVADPARGY
jgi:glyoxylate/hydroxypyruvate reductase A